MSKAGPYDCVFTYDCNNQEIVFGDNEQGAVPQAGDYNIIVTRCVTSKGSMGNIASMNFEPFEYGNISCIPYNPVPALGGRDAESIEDAVERVKVSLKQVVKAVTVADYEELAAATPGLRIMGVKAIPLYDPDSRVTGDKQAPATVTVVVLPCSEDAFPMPDQQFLEAVRKHLEQYRLITTNVKVIGPVYIKISVYAEVILESN
ncbi:MAG: baseplate J/gp47 family protein, partial [Desulfosporosinus sp.]